MFERIAGGDFSPVLVNLALLASWPVMPVSLVAYVRQSLAARRMRAEFSLHKSEAAELDRALLLHETVCRRLKEIDDRSRQPSGLLGAVFATRPDADEQAADERDDLEAHARHLRATIVRLRGLPLRRLQAWIRAASLRFTLGRALAVHIGVFALLIVALHLFGEPASAREFFTAAAGNVLVWYPFDATLFQANAAGACFAALLAPAFYLTRRKRLRREFGLEFCVLKQLAATEPGRRIGRPERSPDAEPTAGECWFATLGVSEAATIEEVREAYKALIKQNHPDRVHDMSPAIKKSAEAETKRLNAAYQEALDRLT